METVFYDSPIGCLEIRSDGENITYLGFPEGGAGGSGPAAPVIAACIAQLREYFDGTRKAFDLPLLLSGTPFRRRVWDELARIPYGETRSYKDIAIALGNEKAVRAVGGANHHNPVSIIVPCHRVIGAGGGLTGYGGGLWRKEWLLEHEKKYI